MISIVVAVSENNVIGRGDEIPWYLPGDLRHFKALTEGRSVIMGRKTYESIVRRNGKPLPNRENLVMTRNPGFSAPGCTAVHDADQLKRESESGRDFFVIGGSDVYRIFLPLTGKLYLTRVHAEIPGDVFFPEWDPSEWIEEGVLNATPHPRDQHKWTAHAFRRR